MQIIEIGKLLIYEQPSKYIVKSTEYDDYYAIPVLTAGKTFILGYTDETDNVFDKLPVIIFDDFTTATKYVDFKFKVKSSAMKILHINQELVLPKYIFYRLQTINIDHSTHKRYWIQQYSKIKITIPTIPEQERIVKQIEEAMSQLDSAVATLKKTKQQLEIYRQAVLKEVFSSCDAVEIQYVCEHVTDGDHMPPPKSEQGIPFIMISNIVGNTIDWNGTAFVSKEYYDKIGDKRTPQKGDVLYTVTGSFGIPVLIDFEKAFCFQRHIALLRPNDKIEQDFLYYALQDSTVYAQASKRATGTAQRTVGLTVLRTIKIPFTESKEKQTKMVSIIKNRLSQCDIVEKTVNQSLQQAEALRQSILKQAFEG